MNRVNRDDLNMLHRMADGELSGAELEDCRRRLAGEPALRAALEEVQGLRSLFAAGRRAAPALAPTGFTGDVLVAARRQALAASGRAPGDADPVAFCRRLLLVAAAVIAALILLHTWVLTSRGPSDLQAKPDEARQRLERLDEMIRAQAPTPQAGERGR